MSFFLLVGNAIFAAWLLEDASWLFNLVVASLVGLALTIDDMESRKRVPPPEG